MLLGLMLVCTPLSPREAPSDTDSTRASESAPEPRDSSADSQTPDSPSDSQRDSAPRPPVQHLVIAGDSWSTGSVQPTLDSLAARGHEPTVTWEETAIAGSQASEWVANDQGKLDALDRALDGPGDTPPADLLLLYLGGNDYNFGLLEGLGWDREWGLELLLDQIEEDLETLVRHALEGRPQLHIVLVDYSYFHYEWFTLLYGLDLDASSRLEYNQGTTALGQLAGEAW